MYINYILISIAFFFIQIFLINFILLLKLSFVLELLHGRIFLITMIKNNKKSGIIG